MQLLYYVFDITIIQMRPIQWFAITSMIRSSISLQQLSRGGVPAVNGAPIPEFQRLPQLIQKTAEGGIPDMILAIDKHHIQLGKGILERIFYDESAVDIELDN